MRKTKFDVNLEICKKVVADLSGIECNKLTPFVQRFSKSIDQIDRWVTDNQIPAPKTEIAKGLEQGLNDLSVMIDDLEPESRSKAFVAFYEAVISVNPDYFETQNIRVQRVIKRGKINKESEYYLLRNRLDKIEGNNTQEELLLVDLLGKYETQS